MTGLALALLEASAWAALSTALGRAGIGLAFKAFRFPDLDGAFNEAFEGPQGIAVVGGKERDRHSVHVGPPGPPYAVDVILGVGWKVKIDDVGNPLDVDSAGRDIGGHKDPNIAILEIL